MVLQRYTLSAPDGTAAPRPLLNVTLRPHAPLHIALDRVSRPRPSAARLLHSGVATRFTDGALSTPVNKALSPSSAPVMHI